MYLILVLMTSVTSNWSDLMKFNDHTDLGNPAHGEEGKSIAQEPF